MTTHRGRLVLLTLALAALTLIALEFALGANRFGTTRLTDPCTSQPTFRGGGIDGTIQRATLAALSGAACNLHTSREALVLSFTHQAKTTIKWNTATTIRALAGALTGIAAHTLSHFGGS